MTGGLAEQPLAGDGEQPTLLRRCGCSPRLKRSVRWLRSGDYPPRKTESRIVGDGRIGGFR